MSGNADIPYLGSRISLISKAEIRYEGILYTIDPNEATVALSKVRSFGTEDRPAEQPVPPREDVFEYIIFRGSDIKDLHVCEPPKANTLNSLSQDPAIVQSSMMSPGMAPGPHGPTYSQSFNHHNPQNFSASNVGQFSNYPSYQSHQYNNAQMSANASTHSDSRGATPPLDRSSGANYSRQYNHNGMNDHMQHQRNHDGIRHPSRDPTNFAPRSNGRRVLSASSAGGRGANQLREFDSGRQTYNSYEENQQRSYGGGGGGYQQMHPRFPQRMQGMQAQMQRGVSAPTGERSSRARSTRGYYFYGGGRGGPMRGYGRPGYPRGPRSGSLKFDSEFDFELSNAKFDKFEIEKELKEKLTIGSNEETEDGTGDSKDEMEHLLFYDKSKSFFDTISCEAIDRASGSNTHPNWKEERKLNAETFGLRMASHYNRMFRGRYIHRGYDRGSFQRGNYRGAGDRGYSRAEPRGPQHNPWTNQHSNNFENQNK